MFEDLADRHLTKERKPASYLVAVIGYKERRPFAMYMRVRILSTLLHCVRGFTH